MNDYPAEVAIFALIGLWVVCWLVMAAAIYANLQLIAWCNRARATKESQ